MCKKNFLLDIRNYNALEEKMMLCAPDIIIHMAAQPLVRESYLTPIETLSTNVMGTANVLDICKKMKDISSVLVITTDKCYENKEHGRPFKETDAMGGHDPYSASKACAELVTASYISSFFQDTETRVVTARAGNVIGGGDWNKDRLVPDAMRAFAAEKSIFLRSPEAIRPWQHVVDSIAGYLSLLSRMEEKANKFASYNFGPPPESMRTAEDVVTLCAEHWEGPACWKKAPSPRELHEAHTLTLDSRRAYEELNWQPRLSIDETVKQTVEWYALHHKGASKTQLINHMMNSFRMAFDGQVPSAATQELAVANI